jgi:hypothetical protein
MSSLSSMTSTFPLFFSSILRSFLSFSMAKIRKNPHIPLSSSYKITPALTFVRIRTHLCTIAHSYRTRSDSRNGGIPASSGGWRLIYLSIPPARIMESVPFQNRFCFE